MPRPITFSAFCCTRRAAAPKQSQRSNRGRLQPGAIHYRNNLGNILRDCSRAEEACICYRKALLLLPDLHHNLGKALVMLGQDAEAEAAFRRGLQLTT